GIVLRIAMRLAPSLAVALAAGAGQHQVMMRHQLPARLVQVLTDVLRVGVVGGMPFHRLGPMVGCPYHVAASKGRTGAESASAGEKIDYVHGLPLVVQKWPATGPWDMIGTAGTKPVQAPSLEARAGREH